MSQRWQDRILLLQCPTFLHFKKQTTSNRKCGVMFTAGNCRFGLTLPISFHVLTILQPLLLLKNQGEIIFSGQRVQPRCYLHLLITSKCTSHQHISLDLVKFLTLWTVLPFVHNWQRLLSYISPEFGLLKAREWKMVPSDLLPLTLYSAKERTPAKKATNVRAS